MSAGWSGHYSVDPAEMEARFANEDSLAFMDSVFTEPTEDDVEQIGQIQGILEDLPPREADFVELYYFHKLRQTDIATIFNVSQPTVCYRLKRATERIRFLLYLPKADEAQMEADLAGFLMDPLDVRIMILMWKTTCQSEVAKILGVSQGLVRHRFLRSVSRMESSPKFQHYATIFRYISENLNILREVQRPVWDDKVSHVVT